MAKEKKLFKVFRKEEIESFGECKTYVEPAGKTWAVSAKQAANNVAFRCGERTYDITPLWGDGARTVSYYAEEV